MVVGSGMMAQAFPEYAESARTVIFASGVSNSLETDPRAFTREQVLLERVRSANPEALLVYFSTCNIEDAHRKNADYARHKFAMESLLKKSPGQWLIFRLPLVIGRGHRGATLAQFLYRKISDGQSFEVWKDATRYPIDVDDMAAIARSFINRPDFFNRRINIALDWYPVTEFVRIMEDIVGRKARSIEVNRGAHQEIPCPEVMQLADQLHIDRSEGYLERVLRKYFTA